MGDCLDERGVGVEGPGLGAEGVGKGEVVGLGKKVGLDVVEEVGEGVTEIVGKGVREGCKDGDSLGLGLGVVEGPTRQKLFGAVPCRKYSVTPEDVATLVPRGRLPLQSFI